MTIGTRDNPANNNTAKTEPKVRAAAFGASGGVSAGVVLASVILWVLDNYVITPGTEGDNPWQVTGAVQLGCTVGLAWAAAWWAGRRAKHQWRQAEIPSREASEKVVEPEGLE